MKGSMHGWKRLEQNGGFGEDLTDKAMITFTIYNYLIFKTIKNIKTKLNPIGRYIWH